MFKICFVIVATVSFGVLSVVESHNRTFGKCVIISLRNLVKKGRKTPTSLRLSRSVCIRSLYREQWLTLIGWRFRISEIVIIPARACGQYEDRQRASNTLSSN